MVELTIHIKRIYIGNILEKENKVKTKKVEG